MASEISDNFNRPNEALDAGSNWDLVNNGAGNGTLVIASNVVATPSSADSSVKHATAISSANHYATIDNTGTTGGDYCIMGPVVRMPDATTANFTGAAADAPATSVTANSKLSGPL